MTTFSNQVNVQPTKIEEISMTTSKKLILVHLHELQLKTSNV